MAAPKPQRPAAPGVRLDIAIIGAGIAGLSHAIALSDAGHKCTIYESSPEISEFGAGIQLSANSVRIFHAWGLEDHFKRVVNVPSQMSIRRWDTDREIGGMVFNPVSEWLYGWPYWQIHRGDLANILHEGVKRRNVDVELGRAVVKVVVEEGVLLFEDGSAVVADLIVCADGIGSRTRKALVHYEGVVVKPFKEHCYRVLLKKEAMMKDEETAVLMEPNTSSNVWFGPGLVVLCYVVRGGELFNVVISVLRPNTDGPVTRWNQSANIQDIKRLLKGWCPVVQKMGDLVEEAAVWTLAEVPTVKRYVSDNGRFAVVGDAAHAILPHLGQGSSMAAEDAAAMAEFLSTIQSTSELPRVMSAWSDMRQQRVERLRQIAQANSEMFRLPDGPLQQKRDEQLARNMQTWEKQMAELGENGLRDRMQAQKPELDPDQTDFSTTEAQMYINGYDVAVDARIVASQVK